MTLSARASQPERKISRLPFQSECLRKRLTNGAQTIRAISDDLHFSLNRYGFGTYRFGLWPALQNCEQNSHGYGIIAMLPDIGGYIAGRLVLDLCSLNNP
jgi:hypothetical protein